MTGGDADEAREGLARFKIARRTLAKPRGALGMLVAAILAWIVLVPAMLSLLGVTGEVAAFAGLAALIAMVGGLLVYLNLGGQVLLGADGLFADRRDGGRYICYADVERVTRYDDHVGGKTIAGVRLHLVGGEVFVMPIGERRFGGGRRADELVVATRARLKRFRKRHRETTDVDAGILARGDRDTRAWLSRLRQIGEGANAHPREAAVDSERLWRIVESPDAPAEARAGAAAALSVRLDARDEERLRFVLDETAQPRVRVVLSSLLEHDEQALVEALAELDEQPARSDKTA